MLISIKTSYCKRVSRKKTVFIYLGTYLLIHCCSKIGSSYIYAGLIDDPLERSVGKTQGKTTYLPT